MIRRQSEEAAGTAGRGRRLAHLRRGVTVVVVLLLVLSLFPVGKVQAAEGALLQLSLQAGSASATVNGKPVTIPKPFAENGTLLVPLGIFKKAFGSTVSLTGDDVVKVMYGPHTGAMTIGSMTAWKDGVKIKLAAPPRMVSGVLMVPLRFVAGVLGARMTPTEGGGILITLSPPVAAVGIEAQSGIDSDSRQNPDRQQLSGVEHELSARVGRGRQWRE